MTLGNVVVKGNICSSCSSRLVLSSEQLPFKEEVKEEGGWPCPVLYWKETSSSLSPHGGRSPFSAYECQKQHPFPGLKFAAVALMGAERSASVMPLTHSSGRMLCRLPNSFVAKHWVYNWPLTAFKKFVLFVVVS